jgi:hypothetical protein
MRSIPEPLIRMSSEENPKKPMISGTIRGNLIDRSFTLQLIEK